MTPVPFMTDEETALLARGIGPQDRVWEWGSGASTLWLSQRCRQVTSVEHQPSFATSVIAVAPSNVSVIYHPVNPRYVEGTEDDGSLDDFRDYVEVYTGKGIDVVIFDGRARLWCARQVAECAAFGPHPDMRFYLHDCDREQYDRIWKDNAALWGDSWFAPVERVGNLVQLKVRE